MPAVLRPFGPMICLLALVIIAQPLAASSPPLPDIKINGVDGPLSLAPTDELKMTLSMDCLGTSGMADWWVAVGGPFGLTFLHPEGWDVAAAPCLQADLFDFGPTTLFSLPLAGFPMGSYTIYFGVDTVPDGQLSIASFSFDEAFFVVGGGSQSSMTIGPEGGVLEVTNQAQWRSACPCMRAFSERSNVFVSRACCCWLLRPLLRISLP